MMKRSDIKRKTEIGIALMIALMFIVVLTVLVTAFAYEVQVDASAITLGDSEFEALLAAKSAIAMGMGLLQEDLFLNEEEGELFDSYDEIWAQGIQTTQLNDVMFQLSIGDEFGKLNLNALILVPDIANNQTEDEVVYEPLAAALSLLFQARGMTFDPTDAILDWLDSDDDERENGFESAYYQSLENPYECKNGPMDTIEELLLIPGIDADIYFGSGGLPLTELLTVHGHPEGIVNINTASREVLEALFASMIDRFPDPSDTVSSIIERREEVGPYLSRLELTSFNGPPPNPQATPQTQQVNAPLEPVFFDVSSGVFRFRADAMSGESQVRVEAYIWRSTTDVDRSQLFRTINWRILQ